MKVLFLLGQRVRSGTNFIGTTLMQHPDVVTMPKETSLGEFNLFKQDANIESVFDQVANNSFGLKFNKNDKEDFLQAYGNCWLELIKEKYKLSQNNILFLKSPYIENLDLWQKTFPQCKIGILIRDGRDNVISSVRASNDKRVWHSWKMSLKKRINHYSGRSFLNHTKAWRDSAKSVLTARLNQNVKVFRYEDLNNSRAGIQNLLDFYELTYNDDILERCLNAPVVGSSFGINTNKEKKPNWTPNQDKSNFQFSNKWRSWGVLKRMVFKAIANSELIKLGYESNTKW